MRYIQALKTAALASALALIFIGCPERERDAVIDGIEFVWCPAGTFMMGRAPGELGSYYREDPQHQVTFSRGFWMSKYEITQKQWRVVMGDNPSEFQCFRQANKRPVDQVSWNDVQEFIGRLNELRPGVNFRLPSEAEWEYACRAGTVTRFYWGDDPDFASMGDYAWYEENSEGQTHAVGQKLPNAWGLYDMCGNVWEWIQDSEHDNYLGAPVDGSAWETPGSTLRGVRGGSWYNGEGCRSAFRGFMTPSGLYDDYGFRLVKTPDAD